MQRPWGRSKFGGRMMRQQGGQCGCSRRSKGGIEVGEAAKELGIQTQACLSSEPRTPMLQEMGRKGVCSCPV